MPSTSYQPKLLTPVNIQEIVDKDTVPVWKELSSVPDWCVDENGFVAGIDFSGPHRVSFLPEFIPSNSYSEIVYIIEYLNPSGKSFDLTFRYLTKSGTIKTVAVQKNREFKNRVSIKIPPQEISANSSFKSVLEIYPPEEETVYLLGTWLTISFVS